MARKRSVLGLDIGTYSVKAVEMTGSDEEIAVTAAGWERIPSPDMVSETVRSLIANNRLRVKRCVTAVSGRSVIVRYVTMTKMNPDELRQAVRFEADKYIPYDVNDVQLDCQILGPAAEGGNQVRVLLVAAKKQMIDEHLDILRKVGVHPAVIDVDLFALANVFECCNARGEMAAEGEAVAMVDIGSSKTSICIMRSTDECFTREVYNAGNAMTDAIAKRFGEEPTVVETMKEDPGDALPSMRDAIMPVLEDLANEVRLSFDYYENQYERKVSRVYLSGGGVLLPGTVEALQRIFDVETKRFSPFDYIPVALSDDTLLRERGSDLVVAVGLASRLRRMG